MERTRPKGILSGVPSPPLPSLLTSIALAILATVVFGRNQMAGPEGAVHRFMAAVAAEDASRVVEATSGQGWPDVAPLAAATLEMFKRRATYDVIEIKRNGRQAVAVIEFRITRLVARTAWALHRVGRRWYVDATATNIGNMTLIGAAN